MCGRFVVIGNKGVIRAAYNSLGHIHDRTPAIIPGDLQDQWLDPTMTERD
ncbi:hypothetical protein [uncultured Arthrobacter sp.]|nr:hypothetical protein [uncultured Arthrobacter sp.]